MDRALPGHDPTATPTTARHRVPTNRTFGENGATPARRMPRNPESPVRVARVRGRFGWRGPRRFGGGGDRGLGPGCGPFATWEVAKGPQPRQRRAATYGATLGTGPRPEREAGGGVDLVEEGGRGHRVVHADRQRRAVAQVRPERLQLVRVRRAPTQFLDPLPRRGADQQPIVAVREHEVHDGGLAERADHPERDLPLVVHVAAGEPGGAAGERQLGLDPFVHAGMAGPLAAPGRDQHRRTAGPRREHPVRVQGVAAEVHQRPTGELERPARILLGRGRHRDRRLDLAQLTRARRWPALRAAAA